MKKSDCLNDGHKNTRLYFTQESTGTSTSWMHSMWEQTGPDIA